MRPLREDDDERDDENEDAGRPSDAAEPSDAESQGLPCFGASPADVVLRFLARATLDATATDRRADSDQQEPHVEPEETDAA